MGVVLSGLLGIFGSTLPEIFKFFQDGKDKKHELELLRLQIQRDKELGIQTNNAIELQSDASVLKEAIAGIKTGYKVVDVFSGFVRPVITYLSVLLYIITKIIAVIVYNGDINTEFLTEVLWNDFDKDILAIVIGFWFGSRAFQRARL